MSLTNEHAMRTSGAVILFNPAQEVFHNILTYYDQLEKLYIVDNSPAPSAEVAKWCSELTRSQYLPNHSNKGIAAALNQGACAAIKDGYRYLLTMDQDTKLPESFVTKLLNEAQELSVRNVGIIAPRYSSEKEVAAQRFESRLYTMTSGNLLDLQVYTQVGAFLEELFIDHVDHEYCLRLNAHGFLVVQANRISIPHRPGENVSWTLANKRLRITSHSPTRLYYFCRNGLYVANLYKKQFPEFRKQFVILLLKEVFKIPVQKQPFLRIRLLLLALSHHRRNILGPISLKSGKA